jgi:hypothetical protein
MPVHVLAILGSLAVLTSLAGPKPVRPTPRASVSGYLSAGGLPPIQGGILVTDSSLAFRSTDGSVTVRLRRIDRALLGPTERGRSSRLELAYVNQALGQRSYAFRLHDGVFETDTPGELLRLLGSPLWLYRGDTESANHLAIQISFTDTLYTLFGRPRAALGVVGPHGRKQMHLAQYVRGRDSVALDFRSMVSEAQLRHAFTHEMAHRWVTRRPVLLDSLWHGVPAIEDPRRYGYGCEWEQQAEAVAFAVHFLQSTAGPTASADDGIGLLGHYELMVPGTRAMVRYLVLQPIYRHHPLRTALYKGRTV